jgi:hypothetical protein
VLLRWVLHLFGGLVRRNTAHTISRRA